MHAMGTVKKGKFVRQARPSLVCTNYVLQVRQTGREILMVRIIPYSCLSVRLSDKASSSGVARISLVPSTTTDSVLQQFPERRQRMSDVSPLSGISGLSFDSLPLSPLALLPSPLTPSGLSLLC